MQLPALYAIANLESLSDPEGYVKGLLGAGVSILQLRTKTEEKDTLLRLGEFCLNEIQRGSLDCRLIINDFIDVCQALGADGVHLGQDDCSPKAARESLGPDAIIGFSTHTIEQATQAPTQELNYLAFGPVFDSPTKSGHALIAGTDELAKIVAQSTLPVVAIGGITKDTIAEVFASGASSAAVISDLLNTQDKAELIRAYEAYRKKEQLRRA